MSDDLSAARIAELDPAGMLDDVLDLPEQLADARWRAESAGVEVRERAGGLTVCGMGGSGIGGELAAAIIGRRAARPIRVVHDYELEPWRGDRSLILCSSYSGATEETLACFEAAGAVGAERVALTTGGPLAEAARGAGVPVIGVPSGFQPRATVAYMTVGALTCAEAAGVVGSMREELDGARRLLDTLVAEWGPDADDQSEAKVLARRLHGTLPVVHGGEPTTAAAKRWKSQINENAKLPAFWAVLPDADHNELCGYEGAPGLAPLKAIFLESADQHPRVARRMELTAEVAARLGAAGTERIVARGDTPAERVLSLVLLGDLVSCYLAILAGRDPTPVPVLENFKRALG